MLLSQHAKARHEGKEREECSRVWRRRGVKYVENKFRIDVEFCGCDIEILRLDEAKEEFIDDL